MSSRAALKYEETIIWLKDPDSSKFPWVRQSVTDFCQRQGISKLRLKELQSDGKILLGYADLMKDAPPSFIDGGQEYFYRRAFYLRKDDYEAYKGRNCYPLEAILLETVQPSIEGISPQKKSQIAVRLPASMLQKLEAHTQRTDMSKTEVVIAALAQYLNDTNEIPMIQRIIELEKRVIALEAKS